MAAALARVKKELGADAVILHTRTFKRGGVLGIGARQYIEITASNDVNVRPARGRREPAVAKNAPPVKNTLLNKTYAGGSAASTAVAPAPTFGEAIRAGAAINLPVPPLYPPPALPSSQTPEQLASEVRQIHQMVHRMMRRQGAVPREEMPEALFEQYLALIQQEVSEELAEQVVAAVSDELSPSQKRDTKAIREAVARRVAKMIPVDTASAAIAKPADGRPLTIALIGPTGVGKTTTLAKLAATFKLRHKKKVAMVTIDTYRIAAVDQLRTYASIINVPLHVAQTLAEMREALAQCKGCDVVLIDTAGRSQRDDIKLDALRQFIDVANPHEVHLVLAGTSSQAVLMEAAQRFAGVRSDRIIFTKLDEAVNFGVLLNVVHKVNKQLSYVTTGQEVPHQIEPGRPERLAGLILGERL
jgi:flagellar biosynthesis protein FlhF